MWSSCHYGVHINLNGYLVKHKQGTPDIVTLKFLSLIYSNTDLLSIWILDITSKHCTLENTVFIGLENRWSCKTWQSLKYRCSLHTRVTWTVNWRVNVDGHKVVLHFFRAHGIHFFDIFVKWSQHSWLYSTLIDNISLSKQPGQCTLTFIDYDKKENNTILCWMTLDNGKSWQATTSRKIWMILQ